MSGNKSNRDQETPDENGHLNLKLKEPAALAAFKTCAPSPGLARWMACRGTVHPHKYRDNIRQEPTGRDGAPLIARKIEIVMVPTPEAPA